MGKLSGQPLSQIIRQLPWRFERIFARDDSAVDFDAAAIRYGVDTGASFNPANTQGRRPQERIRSGRGIWETRVRYSYVCHG